MTGAVQSGFLRWEDVLGNCADVGLEVPHAGQDIALLSDEHREQLLKRRPFPIALLGKQQLDECLREFERLTGLVPDDCQGLAVPALCFRYARLLQLGDPSTPPFERGSIGCDLANGNLDGC